MNPARTQSSKSNRWACALILGALAAAGSAQAGQRAARFTVGCTVIRSLRVSVSEAGSVQVAGAQPRGVSVERLSGAVRLMSNGRAIELGGAAVQIDDAAHSELRGEGLVMITVQADGAERG